VDVEREVAVGRDVRLSDAEVEELHRSGEREAGIGDACGVTRLRAQWYCRHVRNSEGRNIVDRDARDERHEQAPREPAERPKRAWRTPEIVDVGDVGELTEAVSENVNDGQPGSMQVTYRP
jgi:hypothetical protein